MSIRDQESRGTILEVCLLHLSPFLTNDSSPSITWESIWDLDTRVSTNQYTQASLVLNSEVSTVLKFIELLSLF